jgi:hypothetical protein
MKKDGLVTDNYLTDHPENLIQLRAQILNLIGDVMNNNCHLSSEGVLNVCRLSNTAVGITLGSLAESRRRIRTIRR